jgi:hypothetical protein
LAAAGLECVSTSITQFEPVADWQQVFALEKTLTDVSFRRNVVERRYYPGFFVLVARRPAAAVGRETAREGARA